MREWFSISEILTAAQSDLPSYERGLRRHIAKHGWREDRERCRKRPKKEGGDQYHISLLPGSVQLRLKAAQGIAPENRSEEAKPAKLTREVLWERHAGLPAHLKAECEERLALLDRVSALAASGKAKQAAIRIACKEARVSVSTYRNWSLQVKGWQRADWLAALAPQYRSAPAENTCHPQAWAVLKADWLRPEKPTLASCYRRMKTAAREHGWQPVPSLRTLRRWIEREVPREVAVMAREKKDVSKQLYPHQRRTRAHYHAMQAVNIDGHKFDVFVDFGGGRIGRPILLAIQDLYSNLMVAHRIDETENKELVRLAIGDMMERYGIPEAITMDNGRAFASKQITGGQKTRYRFKVRSEEPQGLLTTMGVKVIWTQPYSGQSKPIERAFRDLCDTLARHPFCAGAYAGNTQANRPDKVTRAIPIDAFRQFVAREIEAHNERTDRNTETAKGRSFKEVFEESLADPHTLVAMPTAAQRNLWLLAAEQVRASRGSGEIELIGTRYWHPQLSGWAGKRLTVRFDPQNLHLPVKVYDPQDRFLFEAEALSDVAFDDVDAARSHNRKRREFLKAAATQKKMLAELKAEEIARLLPDDEAAPAKRPARKVRRIATGNAAPAITDDFEEREDFHDRFAAAVNALPDDNVLPFSRTRPKSEEA